MTVKPTEVDGKLVIKDLRTMVRYAENPLVESQALTFRSKKVRAAQMNAVADSETGEIVGTKAIYVNKLVDDGGFVKFFAEGVKAAYELTAPGYKTLQVVLRLYQSKSEWNGDQVYVHAKDALGDLETPISERTFQRGLKELLQKRFLAPTDRPGWYWTNPHLFFKGDRFVFLTEYTRKRDSNGEIAESRKGGDPELDQLDFDGNTKRDNL